MHIMWFYIKPFYIKRGTLIKFAKTFRVPNILSTYGKVLETSISLFPLSVNLFYIRKDEKSMKLKRVVVGALAFSMLFGSLMHVGATTYGTSESTGTYVSVGQEVVDAQRHYISKNTEYFYHLYLNKKVTPVVYHIKGNGDDALAFTVGQSVQRTATTNWTVNGSISIFASYSVPGLFETGIDITVGMGYGEAYSSGRTFTASSTVTKTIKDSASTGYYTRVPGQTYFAMSDMAVHTTRSSMNMFYYRVPYGDVALYTIYSRYNTPPWSLY